MKIVIVGGGTAGWLAALFLAKKNIRSDSYVPYDITVVASSNIGIIGAGEGSTGILVDTLVKKLSGLKGINNIDFIKNTNSTIKLGLYSKDWNGVGTSYFSPLQITKTTNSVIDGNFLIAAKYGIPYDATLTGHLWEQDKVPFIKNTFSSGGGYSYHFDAYKVGEYFKEIALQNGVKYIDAEVSKLDINSNTGYLESVDLKDTNNTIVADFWIDASGFNKTLINEMGAGWVSYKKWLPTNTAMPYLHNFVDGEVIKPHTEAWAMPNGWQWQIPTQERYGCGYVYSSDFVDDDTALKELKQITNRDIKPIRTIKYEAGRCNNVWVKNVLAIGLASSFLEPLEATSIHSTIVQLDLFCSFYLSPEKEVTLMETMIKKYNSAFATMVDEFKDLIQIHYMTDREDTPFWKYCKYDLEKTDKVKEILDICKYRSPNTYDFSHYHGTAGWGVWSWVLHGLGYITPRLSHQTLFDKDLTNNDEEYYLSMYRAYKAQSNDYFSHNDFLEYIKK